MARALEQLYADQSDDLSARVAWHYEQAGEDDKAIDYLIRAGERALTQGAPHEARTFFGRALNALQLLDEDHDRRWRAMLGNDSALRLLGDTSERRAGIAELSAISEVLNDDARRATAYECKAEFALALSDYPSAIEAAEQAIAAARRANQHECEVKALTAKAFALILTSNASVASREAARQGVEELLSHLGTSEPSSSTAFALHEASHFYMLDDPGRAAQLVSQSVEMARQIGDRAIESIALTTTAGSLIFLGQHEQAKPILQMAIQLSQSVGAQDYWRCAVVAYSAALIACGDAAAAIPGLEHVLSEFRAVGKQAMIADTLGDLAEAALQRGDWEGAIQRALESRDGFMKCDLWFNARGAEEKLARALLAQGRWAEAQQYAANIWAHRAMQHPGWSACYLVYADVATAAGDTGQSREAIDQGYAAMMAYADKIKNREWRASYLHNVKDNVALAARWHAIHPDAPAG